MYQFLYVLFQTFIYHMGCAFHIKMHHSLFVCRVKRNHGGTMKHMSDTLKSIFHIKYVQKVAGLPCYSRQGFQHRMWGVFMIERPYRFPHARKAMYQMLA